VEAEMQAVRLVNGNIEYYVNPDRINYLRSTTDNQTVHIYFDRDKDIVVDGSIEEITSAFGIAP
jgi:hypothetical protein